MTRRRLAWARYAMVLSLCAGAQPALSAEGVSPLPLPPYVQAYEPSTVDERGLWMMTDNYERALQQSPLVIRDEKLQAYVKDVLCRTVGDDRCKNVRIYIVEMPLFNASMMPNGTMQVFTGLLLRVRSEAELGAVLGHEFAHFELRHTLKGFQRQRTASDVSAWLSVLAGISNTSVGTAQLSIVGSLYSFQRGQEEEADLLGLAYLGSSEYPSSAAADVWKNLMAEQDATYAGRKRKKDHEYTAGFFATHPTDLRRAIYLAEKSKEIGDGGDPGTLGHYAAIRPYLPRWLDDQNKLNDFGGTEYLLNSIAFTEGWTPELLFARGQMYQNRGNPRDLVSAAQYYREAIAAGYVAPEAHRNLGLSLLRNGENSEAAAELASYLRLAPDAEDRNVISALVPMAEPTAATALQLEGTK